MSCMAWLLWMHLSVAGPGHACQAVSNSKQASSVCLAAAAADFPVLVLFNYTPRAGSGLHLRDSVASLAGASPCPGSAGGATAKLLMTMASMLSGPEARLACQASASSCSWWRYWCCATTRPCRTAEPCIPGVPDMAIGFCKAFSYKPLLRLLTSWAHALPDLADGKLGAHLGGAAAQPEFIFVLFQAERCIGVLCQAFCIKARGVKLVLAISLLLFLLLQPRTSQVSHVLACAKR